MNICMATFTVATFAPKSPVELTFVNTTDGLVLQAQGVTDNDGILTIQAEDMPVFVNGVTYKLTASEAWDKPAECLLVTFLPMWANGEWVTDAHNEAVVC